MGVICNMTSSSNSSQSIRPAKNYSSYLDFTHNYERTSGILSPDVAMKHHMLCLGSIVMDHVISELCYKGTI